jgi:hypothetical protein
VTLKVLLFKFKIKRREAKGFAGFFYQKQKDKRKEQRDYA